MTEVSVETCFTDLKVLSLSLNSWHAIVQKDEYELWVATQTLNILCQPLPSNSRWICPRTYCNRCRNIIINHSPAPLCWIVVLSLIPWITFNWMKKEKNKIVKKCSKKNKPTIFSWTLLLLIVPLTNYLIGKLFET